ncbi:MAG: large subunit ribosomal protein L9 [Bacteriovoracaceae bacterium]|jgi:large subunit ribosomal protein L9
MKVILTEKVPALGSVGEIVNVSPGFGRNFLIPNRKAVIADAGSKKQAEHQKKALAKKVAEEKEAALALKKSVDGLVLTMIKKVGGNGNLFGTVTSTEVSKALLELGHDIEKRVISFVTPIKTLGEFDVTAKIFSEVVAEFKVKVEIDPKQAEELKAKQEAAERAAIKRKEAKAAALEAGETGEEATDGEATEAATDGEETEA